MNAPENPSVVQLIDVFLTVTGQESLKSGEIKIRSQFNRLPSIAIA